jgi:hypothetical protein
MHACKLVAARMNEDTRIRGTVMTLEARIKG